MSGDGLANERGWLDALTALMNNGIQGWNDIPNTAEGWNAWFNEQTHHTMGKFNAFLNSTADARPAWGYGARLEEYGGHTVPFIAFPSQLISSPQQPGINVATVAFARGCRATGHHASSVTPKR